MTFTFEIWFTGFINNTLEKKTGLDLNHDGFVGGVTSAEKQYGADFNGDGYVGGEGKYFIYFHIWWLLFIINVGIQSKIERATRVDINNDGVIGRPLDTYPNGGYGGTY